METLTIKLDAETAERLARRARDTGVSPESLAADVVADMVADYDPDDQRRYPPLIISDEELRASIEEQRRQIAAGTAKLIPHEEVMSQIRAKLADGS